METLYQDSSSSATVSFMGEKVCGKCGDMKHVTEFPISRTDGYKDGRENRCKQCSRARWNLYKQNNLERVTESQREWDTEVLHYGFDEKFGNKWRRLGIALRLHRCPKFTAKSSITNILDFGKPRTTMSVIAEDVVTGDVIRFPSMKSTDKAGFRSRTVGVVVKTGAVYRGYKWSIG